MWVKINQGTPGFNPGFHLPVFHFGYPFLTHSHMKAVQSDRTAVGVVTEQHDVCEFLGCQGHGGRQRIVAKSCCVARAVAFLGHVRFQDDVRLGQSAQ